MRLVLEDAPPHREAGEEVQRVFDVEQRARVLERRVVDPREMPDHVVREPERERDRGMRERADRPRARDRGSESGRDREYDEQRRPLGQHDVLEEMHRQEEVHPERVNGRCGDRQQERQRADEAADTPGGRWVPPDREDVRGSQSEDDEHLGVPRPRVRIHGATLVGRGCSSVGRAPAFQAGCRRFEPGRPLEENLPERLFRQT